MCQIHNTVFCLAFTSHESDPDYDDATYYSIMRGGFFS